MRLAPPRVCFNMSRHAVAVGPQRAIRGRPGAQERRTISRQILMQRTRSSRRAFLARLSFAVGAAVGAGTGVVRADPGTPEVPVPAIYLRETGHHIGGPFLAWWLQYGREDGLGWPITEQLSVGGRRVQYFERGALTLDPTSRDPLGVVLMNLGRPYVSRSSAPQSEAESTYIFDHTGHGAHPAVWPYHRENGGVYRFGYPLAPAVIGDGGLWQVFERAVLSESGGRVTDLRLGLMEAERLRLPTEPATQARHAPVVDLAALAPQYGPLADRHAKVDLTRQVVTFFDGDDPVRMAATSTGIYPDFTPAGRYWVFSRIPRARMISNGSTHAVYDLDDVQHIQYFTDNWIGFHYAYWHADFGTARSAGCVNLRLHDSRWAWDFCDHGTAVVVHY